MLPPLSLLHSSIRYVAILCVPQSGFSSSRDPANLYFQVDVMLPIIVLAGAFAPDKESALPAKMTAAYKTFICQTPFKCIKTHEVAVPSPGAGQVLVEVYGSAVNPCDVDYIEFGVGCAGGGGSLGMDLAGVVVATGTDVSRLKVGDQVWADTGGIQGVTGAMAQYALVSEKQTGLKPTTLNFTEAGSIPLVGLTALEMLQKTGAPWSNRTNVTVAITSGSGGTGFMCVQLARAFGAAHVVTAASGAENIAFMKSIGADEVIDYKVSSVRSSVFACACACACAYCICMCMVMCIICRCIRVCVHTYVRAYVCACIRVCVHTCVRAYACACASMCTYITRRCKTSPTHCRTTRSTYTLTTMAREAKPTRRCMPSDRVAYT